MGDGVDGSEEDNIRRSCPLQCIYIYWHGQTGRPKLQIVPNVERGRVRVTVIIWWPCPVLLHAWTLRKKDEPDTRLPDTLRLSVTYP